MSSSDKSGRCRACVVQVWPDRLVDLIVTDCFRS